MGTSARTLNRWTYCMWYLHWCQTWWYVSVPYYSTNHLLVYYAAQERLVTFEQEVNTMVQCILQIASSNKGSNSALIYFQDYMLSHTIVTPISSHDPYRRKQHTRNESHLWSIHWWTRRVNLGPEHLRLTSPPSFCQLSGPSRQPSTMHSRAGSPQ